MQNQIEILSEDGKYVVRIAENGKTVDYEFTQRDHARSWASGQSMRLFHSADFATENLLQAYGHLSVLRSQSGARSSDPS
jgi:hypothetical protein